MSLKRKCSNCAHSGGWLRWEKGRRHAFCMVYQAAEHKAAHVGRKQPRIDQFSCSFWEPK